MTKEQIAYMRYGVEIGEYQQVNEEVGRLLDEREALLEALKAVDSAADTGQIADELEDATRIVQQIARAAIAKAESE